jgi:hemoglobin
VGFWDPRGRNSRAQAPGSATVLKEPPAPVVSASMSDESGATLYERVGGQEWFDALVDRFYATVAEDPVLRPLYPDDLTDARRHLAGFLAQYWGGPPRYSEERGHPRLRMRHFPFAIGRAERDAWFSAMEAAVRASGLPAEDEAAVLDYFDRSATFLINQSDESGPSLGMRPSG